MVKNRIKEFLSSVEWDAPFFKRLAPNDTGQAPGHQGGVLIPKDLRPFFPTLDERQVSRGRPTVDRYLAIQMFIGLQQVGDDLVRYQIQTWGGTRPPEGRLTDNLGPLHREAAEDDLLIFQRSADVLDRFRLLLVPSNDPSFAQILRSVHNRRWGPLVRGEIPVTHDDLNLAIDDLEDLAQQPFMLKVARQRRETRHQRVARSSVFPDRVHKEYDWECAVSQVSLRTPAGNYEVQAAHVVPASDDGTDDIRNGISLSHTLHWAFDRGLFGVRDDRTVYIPRRIRRMAGNNFLKHLSGKRIKEAKTKHLRVHPDAFRWHRENIVSNWE
jgi:putative restriction endonuclease